VESPESVRGSRVETTKEDRGAATKGGDKKKTRQGKRGRIRKSGVWRNGG